MKSGTMSAAFLSTARAGSKPVKISKVYFYSYTNSTLYLHHHSSPTNCHLNSSPIRHNPPKNTYNLTVMLWFNICWNRWTDECLPATGAYQITLMDANAMNTTEPQFTVTSVIEIAFSIQKAR